MLFDVLTTDPPCTSHEDIADRTGWSLEQVNAALMHIRKPEVSTEWGWTVPHQPRGPGEHLYIAVLLEGDRPLDAYERDRSMRGARSTALTISSMCQNEAHAMRVVAKYVPPAEGRLCRQAATALAGAGAMAEELADRLASSLTG